MKIKEYILIMVISVLSIFVNVSFLTIPPGSDMLSHIGAVNNMVWGYKELSFQYPLLMHGMIAQMNSILHISVFTLFKMLHILVIILTAYFFYKLGKETISKNAGFFLAILISLYPSQEFWL